MGTKVRRLIAAAIVVFGLVSGAAAQPGPVHHGVVHDASGRPLPGAVVVFEHPEQTEVRVAVTGRWGEYTVRGLESGTRYDVIVSHPGFHKARLQASIGDHINVQLRPRSSYSNAGLRASGGGPR
jgi:hypothetical protein